jgi:hypothetical protein
VNLAASHENRIKGKTSPRIPFDQDRIECGYQFPSSKPLFPTMPVWYEGISAVLYGIQVFAPIIIGIYAALIAADIVFSILAQYIDLTTP